MPARDDTVANRAW